MAKPQCLKIRRRKFSNRMPFVPTYFKFEKKLLFENADIPPETSS